MSPSVPIERVSRAGQNGTAIRQVAPETSIKLGAASSRKRVTFVIPEVLDQGIEVYCAAAKRLKNEVATVALAEYLRTNQVNILKLLEAAAAEAGPVALDSR